MASTHGTQVVTKPLAGTRSRATQLGTALALILAALLGVAASAEAAPIWRATVTAQPTQVQPGGVGEIVAQVENIGPSASAGEIEAEFDLPPDLTATSIQGLGWACDLGTLTCTSTEVVPSPVNSRPNQFSAGIEIAVDVSPGATGTGQVRGTFSGGGGTASSDEGPVIYGLAPDDFAITDFDGWVIGSDYSPYSQAAGHPYAAVTEFLFATRPDPIFGLNLPMPAGGGPKDIDVELPAGFIGNPEATPKCDESIAIQQCPAATQIGQLSVLTVLNGGPIWQTGGGGGQPIYNMVPGDDSSALFASEILGTNILFKGKPRADGDYGLTVMSHNTSQVLPMYGVRATFWGVPHEPAHDDERTCQYGSGDGTLCDVDIPEKAFLTNPTNCSTGPVTTTLRANGWTDQDAFEVKSFVSHDNQSPPQPLGPTGCDQVPFNPEAEVSAQGSSADSPTALSVSIDVPSDNLLAPKGIAQAHVRRVEMRFPEGMTVNAASADGLGSCSPADAKIGSNDPATCPDRAKLGSVKVETPLLDKELNGSIYLAAQRSNPFNSTLALYLVANGPDFSLKLPGRVTTNLASGRVTATFDNNPQLPFSSLDVHFKTGDRAALATPPTCGKYAIETSMTPWSAADPNNPTPAETVTSTSEFTIDRGPDGGPCLAGDPNRPGDAGDLGARPFDPALSGGLVNPTAGSSSPFVLRLTRPDGHQELKSFSVDLPPGLSAKLAGVPYCPDAALAAISGAEGSGAAQLAAPSCPAASQVGTATIGAGAGTSPFYVQTGKAYLAGPYKGAPLSLAVVTPAVAGPLDLGSVVVRSKIEIDRDDAQVHVTTDDLPEILYGVPLRLRDIRVRMDRPGFMRAPTNCSPMQLTAQLRGSHGGAASKAQGFQVGDCAALGFKPKLSLRLKGKTKRTGHPALTAVLTQPASGQANIDRVSVVLPRAQFIDQSRIGNVCTRPQFAANACPANSVLGKATAYTPLLDQPLTGTVYLRANGGERELPDMVAALRGQIDVDLVGFIDSVRDPKNPGVARIRNTFAIVPDAPVSKFVLKLNAGKKALLVNSQNLCRSPQRATVKMAGQNGKIHNFNPLVKNDCGAKKKAKGKR